MEKRDKEMPYEVIIQERNKVDLYGNVVYYIYGICCKRSNNTNRMGSRFKAWNRH